MMYKMVVTILLKDRKMSHNLYILIMYKIVVRVLLNSRKMNHFLLYRMFSIKNQQIIIILIKIL